MNPVAALVAAVMAVIVAAAPGPTMAGTTGPGLGIKLLDAPKALANDPRAHAYIIDNVPPGAVITRHIEVSNGTSRTMPIEMYADAASIENGGFRVADGRGVNEVVQWTALTPTSFSLRPGETRVVTARISVPRDASRGERYGAVLAETRPPASPGKIALVSRVGIRMYLSVEAGGAPPSDFAIEELTAKRDGSGNPVVAAQVHNTGGRALDMTGFLKLDHGPGGLSAGPFPAKLGTTLAPGQTEPVTVVLNKALPAGPWHARIDLQSGLLKRAAEGTITFPSKPGTAAAPVKAKNISLAKNRHFLIPLAILLLLGIAIGIFLLLWKRRKRKEQEEQEVPAVAARQ